jgi:beta-catenin-like protein 1
MDDHFDRVFAAPSSSDATPFIASNRWQGAKPGYVFTTRRGKVGYYLESAGTAAGAGAEEDADDDPPAAKRVRRAEDEEPSIEQLLAKGDAADIEELDLSGLKQLLLAFEKKINKNQNMRVKFPDEPAKFVESEIELDDEIKRMHSIAAVPELYPQVDFVV